MSDSRQQVAAVGKTRKPTPDSMDIDMLVQTLEIPVSSKKVETIPFHNNGVQGSAGVDSVVHATVLDSRSSDGKVEKRVEAESLQKACKRMLAEVDIDDGVDAGALNAKRVKKKAVGDMPGRGRGKVARKAKAAGAGGVTRTKVKDVGVARSGEGVGAAGLRRTFKKAGQSEFGSRREAGAGQRQYRRRRGLILSIESGRNRLYRLHWSVHTVGYGVASLKYIICDVHGYGMNHYGVPGEAHLTTVDCYRWSDSILTQLVYMCTARGARCRRTHVSSVVSTPDVRCPLRGCCPRLVMAPATPKAYVLYTVAAHQTYGLIHHGRTPVKNSFAAALIYACLHQTYGLIHRGRTPDALAPLTYGQIPVAVAQTYGYNAGSSGATWEEEGIILDMVLGLWVSARTCHSQRKSEAPPAVNAGLVHSRRASHTYPARPTSVQCMDVCSPGSSDLVGYVWEEPRTYDVSSEDAALDSEATPKAYVLYVVAARQTYGRNPFAAALIYACDAGSSSLDVRSNTRRVSPRRTPTM
ncbi:hypothetical protein M422DRAFT_56545 [Sphaerobolus stellatus SS14]|uniref:Uncharacterized protein n=1 Tax=Sphaerobolus stellatus (strain SS14) TaxID=990650 RepID=A0A0C9UF39_SPHS4|nr:hypothetical protein M422DRAFT_56545 [Sphaerobolus stellatus SS14]